MRVFWLFYLCFSVYNVSIFHKIAYKIAAEEERQLSKIFDSCLFACLK